MCEELNRKEFHEAIDTTLSGLQADPWLAQRVVNRERTSEPVMKKKLSISLVLVIVLILITVTALAVVLLSPKDIVESVAVPMAQNSKQENYTYEELVYLTQVLSENGFTLDDGSKVIKAFNAGRGYWKEDTIHEICRVSFGNDELWTAEQKYWYGEILVAVGVWEKNAFVLPQEDELSEDTACILAAHVINDTYNLNLPSVSDESWTINPILGYIQDESTETSTPSWQVSFIPSSEKDELQGYVVTFDLHGENIRTDCLVGVGAKKDEYSPNTRLEGYTKLEKAISEFGETAHFWPDEIKLEIYGKALGEPYAIPTPEEYIAALELAKAYISERYGSDALDSLGNYKVGYLFQKLDDEEKLEADATQMMWDFIFTTDPENLSDGYRVQFQIFIDHRTEKEEITDLIVDHASLGSG